MKKSAVSFLILIFAAVAQVSAQSISFTTLAGKAGVADTVDGTGTAARFSQPGGLAVASNGDIYVGTNSSVRKVTTDGVVTTFASLGSRGEALAFDAAGNLFVAEPANDIISKVTPSGVVTIFAGQPGVGGNADGSLNAARFNQPGGLAFDSAGNLYVADTLNHSIRKIATDGTVSTVAGLPGVSGLVDGAGPLARFNYPNGLAFDASGNLYVVDTGNGAVRRIAPDGIVTTLAGGASTYGAFDGTGSNARFSSPTDIAIDAAGNLYVTEGDHLIRTVTPDGVVTTIGGQSSSGWADGVGSAARFSSPRGIGVTAGGDLYISDSNNDVIRKGVRLAPPAIGTAPVAVSVPVGQAATFSVAVSSALPVTYQWQRQAAGTFGFQPLAEGSGFTGTQAASLSIAAPTTAMNGDQYRCVLNNGSGSVVTTTSVTLSVTTPPAITSVASATFYQGIAGTFTFQASGSPAPTFSVASGALPSWATLDAGTGVLSGTPTSTTSVTFTVTASNGIGTPVTQSFTLTLQPAPTAASVAMVGAAQVVVTRGQAFTLSSIVGGTAPLAYQWLHNGLPVAGATNATYSVAGAAPVDAGAYQLQVKNPAGTARSGAHFVNVAYTKSEVIGWGVDASIPASLTTAMAVAAGDNFGLALLADTTVVGFGANDSGQTSVPAGLSGVVAIAAGGGHGMALKSDGTVVAWGNNSSGQATVPGGLANVVAIAAGSAQSMALKSDGTVVAWGSNGGGQAAVPANLTNVVAIAADNGSSFALRADGTVVAWVGSFNGTPLSAPWNNLVGIAANTDDNLLGLKADGTVVASGSFSQPPATATNVVQLASSFFQAVALRADGTLVMWGPDYNDVVPPPANLRNVVAISANNALRLALRDASSDAAPVVTTSPASTALNQGQSVTLHAAAITGTAPVNYQWYRNGAPITGATADSYLVTPGSAVSSTYYAIVSNSLGSATTGAASIAYNTSPVVSATTPGRYPVNAGGNLTLTLASSISGAATVQWRRNSLPIAGATGRSLVLSNVTLAQAGYYQAVYDDGSGPVASAPIFVPVVPAATEVLAVGNSGYYSSPTVPAGLSPTVAVGAGMAVKADGTVVQWNSANNYAAPSGLGNVVAVVVGVNASYALLGDGTVTAWGSTYSTPTWNPPAGLNNVVAIAAGTSHALALRADGTVVAWGSSTAALAVPASLSNVVAVAAGNQFSLALRADGQVIGWGLNDDGQSSPPVGLSNVVAIAAYGSVGLAVRADGTVVQWGYTSYNSAFVPPADLGGVVAVALGDGFAYAQRSDGSVVGWGQLSNAATPPIPGFKVFSLAVFASYATFVRDATADKAPVISTPPTSATLGLGQSSTLAVTVDGGSASISYQWRKDGAAIAGATDASLVLPYATATTAGSYDAVVTDHLGSVASAPAVIAVSPTAAVSVSPDGRQVVGSGQAVTLTGSATISGTLTYQWLHGGQPVAGATTATLTLAAVQLSSAGAYQLRVTNSVGPAVSMPVFLVVTGPTQTLAWGSNTSGQIVVPTGVAIGVVQVAAGAAHSLALKSDGTVVAWGNNSSHQCDVPADLNNVVDIAAGNAFSMALQADGTIRTWGLLNFTPVGAEPAIAIAASPTSNSALALEADGTVVAWDQYGARTDGPANLIQVVAIAVGSPNVALRADGTVVQWTGGSSPATVTIVPGITTATAIAAGSGFGLALLADGTVTAWGNGYYGLTHVPAGLSHVVAIAAQDSVALALKDDGTLVQWGYSYSLNAASLVESAPVVSFALGSSHLLVLRDPTGDVAPTLSAQTADQTVSNGQALTLSVTATGTPSPIYQWYRNGSAISGANAATYYVPSVTTYMAGTYTVVVSNSKGIVVSGAINVVVKPLGLAPGLLASSAVVNGGGDVIVGSFTVENASKNILVRAAGPALAAFGITNAMADPQLSVTDANGTVLATNDDWGTAGNLSYTTSQVGAFAFSANSKDAALLRTFAPGTYHVRVTPATGAGGVVMLQIYDADSAPRLVYESTLGLAGAGARVLVDGLIVAEPPAGRSYLVRALGPALGTTGVLADPRIAVFDATGTQVAANAGWGDDAALAALGDSVGATPLAAGSHDAALNFVPARRGTYTIQVKGPGNEQGLVLLEVFEVDAQRSTAIAPAVVAPPQNTAVLSGGSTTLAAVVLGEPAPALQWRKDGAVIGGATNATLTLANVQPSDAGAYSIKASNGSGTATSPDANVTVVTQLATHGVVGTGYVAGGTATITNTLTYIGTASSLGWTVTLPPGWSFASGGGTQGDVTPAVGTTDTLEWAWSTPPPSPIVFSYTLNVPVGDAGTKSITASAIVRVTDPAQTIDAEPAVLEVDPSPNLHSADTDGDSRIGLLELTRVIELYNTRNGTNRTGCYDVATTATEDGFAPDAARSNTATVTLSRYHTADENHDGKIGLFELTRVIELYNYRSGTTRTGQYHVQAGTEDGFAPGP